MAHGYPGSYAAEVVDAADPMEQHRLQVRVPALGDDTMWAAASMPPGEGEPVPAVGDAVNVLFEQGDTDRPVWYGGPVDPRPATEGLVGTYRGWVVASDDPEQLRRLQVAVPSVQIEAIWATPGVELGEHHEVPGPGTAVWLTFQGGDPNHPVWIGVA